jgi:hypothetical protein
MKVFLRVAYFGVFLTFCGCAQFVQYPPIDKGWVKLNAHYAARLDPLLAQTPALHDSYSLYPDLKIVIDPVYAKGLYDSTSRVTGAYGRLGLGLVRAEELGAGK